MLLCLIIQLCQYNISTPDFRRHAAVVLAYFSAHIVGTAEARIGGNVDEFHIGVNYTLKVIVTEGTISVDVIEF